MVARRPIHPSRAFYSLLILFIWSMDFTASLLLASAYSTIFYFEHWCIIQPNSYSQGGGTLIGPNSSVFGRQLLVTTPTLQLKLPAKEAKQLMIP